MKMDLTYLKMAALIGENSYAKKMQVGCLIVKGTSIISDGFNGTPSGFPNVCEDAETGKSFPWVLHAESNAIAKLARSTQTSEGATLFTTVSPCVECAKLIIQAGITRVVYACTYKRGDGLALLAQAGIELEKLKIPGFTCRDE